MEQFLRRVLGPAVAATVLVGTSGCRSSQVYFSNDANVTEALTDHMGSATETLDVAVYTFTSEEIRDAIIDAKGRGVSVRVVIDVWSTNDEVANFLDKEGVPMKRAAGYAGDGEEAGIMHHKFAVVDGRSVATGSFNYTLSADGKNYENLLIVTDPALAGQYTSAFDEIWNKAD